MFTNRMTYSHLYSCVYDVSQYPILDEPEEKLNRID